MNEEGPFYLDRFLYCHAPMWAVIDRRGRRYRCKVCNQSIDALAAEVEVWEQATAERPELGFWGTPYEERAARLTGVLRWARRLDTGGYVLRWIGSLGWADS
ncbi:hypothetical protein GCM10009682_15130 [Luedemannella flava]|uniref:Uncharacterized protein n=1 Tax=Luedemannella flava TaxID=349316 RepID=A0ABP4XY20_9ACTN